MKPANRPAQSSGEFGSTMHWGAGWLPTMERSGQRLQQFQHAAQDFQKTVNQESISQIEDIFAAISQISSAVNDAAREPSISSVFSAQPRVLECMMEMNQKGNERLMRITERMNACTAAMANGEATESVTRATEEASGDGSETQASIDSGAPGRVSGEQGKRAAAAQGS